MKSTVFVVVFSVLGSLSVWAAEPTLVDTEKVISQAKSAATASSAHQAALKSSGIEDAAKALAEERKKNPPDHARIAELATSLSHGLKRVADVQPVVDQLDGLREQFQDTADQLRAEAERGAGNAKLIAEKLAAPYDARMRTLAGRIKTLPADSPQAQRLREDFGFAMAMRDEARRQAASTRADTGVDMRGLAEKYDRAAGAVLITKRELLVRSMKLTAAAEQLESLATMTQAARALDDATATVAALGQATDTSLREVDGTMQMLDRTFDTIMAKVSASTGAAAIPPAPSPEQLEKELQEYSRPASTYYYGRGDRRR